MTVAQVYHEDGFSNPLDLMEQIVSAHEWTFDRATDQDLAVEICGHWCDYRMFVTWHPEMRALLFACAFDMRVPASARRPVNDLLTMVNEKLLIGHFDLWADDGLPVFRHAIPLRGVAGASVEQLEDLLEIALTECERFYPAFQFVIWGGKDPGDAIAAAVLETVGEA
jgi:hypothetical protein